ncbi:DUF218 domain [Seminavis robusta]|uniref:DUF218 domain n=1 Tax=Seminavis robusta TaxID=568900 RepID=A0A9N8DHS0_9STRA|nr:DUF218 domain [Seminavis robusta]|eukprot:Sro152_g069410.1 DUF218 domain (602) ;mRNA; f:32775-34580
MKAKVQQKQSRIHPSLAPPSSKRTYGAWVIPFAVLGITVLHVFINILPPRNPSNKTIRFRSSQEPLMMQSQPSDILTNATTSLLLTKTAPTTNDVVVTTETATATKELPPKSPQEWIETSTSTSTATTTTTTDDNGKGSDNPNKTVTAAPVYLKERKQEDNPQQEVPNLPEKEEKDLPAKDENEQGKDIPIEEPKELPVHADQKQTATEEKAKEPLQEKEDKDNEIQENQHLVSGTNITTKSAEKKPELSIQREEEEVNQASSIQTTDTGTGGSLPEPTTGQAEPQNENDVKKLKVYTSRKEALSDKRHARVKTTISTTKRNVNRLRGTIRDWKPLKKTSSRARARQSLSKPTTYTDSRFEEMKAYNGSVFHHPEDIPSQVVSNMDAILVVGGGMFSSQKEPSPVVQQTLEDVITLLGNGTANGAQASGNNTTLPILCLSNHAPPAGSSLSQAAISASYLMKEGKRIGLDPDHIYMESTSLDLIGAAFYSRKNFADSMGWKNLLIVVNQLVQPYTEAVFQWIYGLDASNRAQGDFNLLFLVPPDIVVETPPYINTHPEKVAHVAKKLAPRLRTMQDVHHFLNHEHELYSARHVVQSMASVF